MNASKTAYLLPLLLSLSAFGSSTQAGGDVNITHSVAAVDVLHQGKIVKIEYSLSGQGDGE